MNELKTMEKKRETNIDILRIISMLMVLTLHYLSKGGLLDENNVNGLQYYINWVIECMSIVAVNCYVLISGFLLVKSEFKIKKVITLWLEVIFYSIFIYVIIVIFNLKQFNIMDAFKSCFPVLNKGYWFVNTYLILYLLSPYINKLIMNMTKEEFKKILIILIIIFSIMTILPSSMNMDSTNGYGIIWFICLYLIGAYINLYIPKENNKKNKYLVYYLTISLILFVIIITMKYITSKMQIKDYSFKILSYNNILVLIESVSLFLYFRNIEIKKDIINKIILYVAPLTFSVYLIHEQPILRTILYTKILNIPMIYNNPYALIVMIISIILIFLICISVESIRRNIVNKIRKIKSKIKF